MFLLPRKRIVRPNGIARIDYSNPLTNNVRYLADVTGSSLYDLHNKVISNPTGAITTQISNIGYCASSTVATNYVQALTANQCDALSTTDITIALIKRRLTTTPYSSMAFGYNVGANRVLSNLPWSDSVIYWDYGSYTATSRLATYGQSIDTKIDTYLFIAGGGKGRELWRRGVKINNDTNAADARSVANTPFYVFCDPNNTVGADEGELYYFGIFNEAWSDEKCEQWSDNPWQLFEQTKSIVYTFPTVASGITLTAANLSQANTVSTGAITQAHLVAAANLSQADTISTNAVVQTHLLAASNLSQANTLPGVAVSINSTVFLTAANLAQGNTLSTGAVTQTHLLTGANASQADSLSIGAVSQTHLLLANGLSQANTLPSVALPALGTVFLVASDLVQLNTLSDGAITIDTVVLSVSNFNQSNYINQVPGNTWVYYNPGSDTWTYH